MSFRGNGAYWLREHLAAMIRNRTRNTGKVAVAVTGRQFRDIAETQDRIHDSGRYSAESRLKVPRGQMIAPTDHYQVSGVANVSYKNRGGNFGFGKGRVNLSDTKVTATVRLTIEPIDITTGLSGRGYEVTGVASRSLNRNISGGSFRSYGSTRSSASNIEADLLSEAAEGAVEDFLDQFSP